MSKRSVVVALALCLAFSQAFAQKAEPSAAIEYKPPQRGTPVGRIGGGTRGIAVVPAPALTALTPDHVALTTSEQPTLYWFLPAKSAVRIEVALIDSSGVKPLMETSYANLEPGIHRIDLKDFNVRLKLNEEYRWSVALVVSDKQRSRDVVSQGSLRLVELPTDTRASMATRSRDEQAVAYASLGIWHDALNALSESISAAPERRELRSMRAALLDQAGLKSAAEFDRKAVR